MSSYPLSEGREAQCCLWEIIIIILLLPPLALGAHFRSMAPPRCRGSETTEFIWGGDPSPTSNPQPGGSEYVWHLPQNRASKDGPATSYAADGGAFEFDGACKLHHHAKPAFDKVEVLSRGTWRTGQSLSRWSNTPSRSSDIGLTASHCPFSRAQKGGYIYIYICNFPLYTRLTFLIVAAFQRAILHPGFSTLPVHH